MESAESAILLVEAGELMDRLPGLTLGAASELILESRDGRVPDEFLLPEEFLRLGTSST